jgi:hypothetical protein
MSLRTAFVVVRSPDPITLALPEADPADVDRAGWPLWVRARARALDGGLRRGAVGRPLGLRVPFDSDDGTGSPGSATKLFSTAFQSFQQASWCFDQVWQSCPRSVFFPLPCKKLLSVTTTIPLRQRVRATFMRGCDFKKPGHFVRTEDRIT